MADQDGLDGLEGGFTSSGRIAAEFEAELGRLRQTMLYTNRETAQLSAGLGGGLRRAFDGLAFDGMKLSDALKGVARSLVDTAFNIAMKPVQQALSGAIAGGMNAMLGSAPQAFAKGGVFTEGRVMPFARGGIVTQPVHFPLRGGTGLMGEAGPEAIMPLRRGADGRLGVVAAGAGGGPRPVQVTVNISTPDIHGFARSQSQIAAQMSRALARGERNS